MALDSWLSKVKTAISNSIETVRSTAPFPARDNRKPNVGVLAFEVASLMSKLLQLWQSVSDRNVMWIRHEAIGLQGVRKIVSNDDSFLLGLACAEISESLRQIANSVSRIAPRCDDSALRSFERLFQEFADTGKDSQAWVLARKEMENKAMKKMKRYVSAAASLHKEIDEVSETEQTLRRLLGHGTEFESPIRAKRVSDLQLKLFWKRQEVKQLKEKSLWNRSLDSVVLLLARSVFTVLARVKLVFGIGHDSPPVSLPRSLSATVYPTDNPAASCKFVSGPLISKPTDGPDLLARRFFDSNTKLLKPPPSTLGSAALALHYANLIIVMEKMIRSPHLIGVDARDDLYAMLPASLRGSLRARLKGVGPTAGDPALAREWREAMAQILEWLAPLAHNMIKWQTERSFEQQNLLRRTTNVLMLQTLFFANRAKTEAAITELLVGLNYIWRFEREMNAIALMECGTQFHGLFNSQN